MLRTIFGNSAGREHWPNAGIDWIVPRELVSNDKTWYIPHKNKSYFNLQDVLVIWLFFKIAILSYKCRISGIIAVACVFVFHAYRAQVRVKNFIMAGKSGRNFYFFWTR